MGNGTVSLERLDEEIKHAQYREAAESFCRLVAEENRPLGEVVHTAVGAAAPFVQVPSHLMAQPGGDPSNGVPPRGRTSVPRTRD